VSEKEYGIDNWAPLFSSPEAEQAHTAMMLPAGERQAYLDSLPPVTQEMRDRPYYAPRREEAEPEAGA
jgi:hypothetical protein